MWAGKIPLPPNNVLIFVIIGICLPLYFLCSLHSVSLLLQPEALIWPHQQPTDWFLPCFLDQSLLLISWSCHLFIPESAMILLSLLMLKLSTQELCYLTPSRGPCIMSICFSPLHVLCSSNTDRSMFIECVLHPLGLSDCHPFCLGCLCLHPLCLILLQISSKT